MPADNSLFMSLRALWTLDQRVVVIFLLHSAPSFHKLTLFRKTFGLMRNGRLGSPVTELVLLRESSEDAKKCPAGGSHSRSVWVSITRELFFGFEPGTPPSKRWHEMSHRKLAELEALIDQFKTNQRLLQRIQSCRCDALDECGKRLLISRNRP